MFFILLLFYLHSTIIFRSSISFLGVGVIGISKSYVDMNPGNL